MTLTGKILIISNYIEFFPQAGDVVSLYERPFEKRNGFESTI
jgi:hypothetical protein